MNRRKIFFCRLLTILYIFVSLFNLRVPNVAIIGYYVKYISKNA